MNVRHANLMPVDSPNQENKLYRTTTCDSCGAAVQQYSNGYFCEACKYGNYEGYCVPTTTCDICGITMNSKQEVCEDCIYWSCDLIDENEDKVSEQWNTNRSNV